MRAVRPILSLLLLSSFLPLVGRPAARPDVADNYRGAYFAPVMSFGLWRMRAEDGAIREFEAGRDRGKMRSVDGWTAQVKGQDVTVWTPAGERPSKRYSFSNGTLVEVKVGKKVLKPAADGPVVYEDETVWPLLPEEDEIDSGNLPVGTWERKSSRLRLWFDSPNQAGTFISFLLILFVSLAFRLRNRAFRVVCVLLSLGALAALLGTDSRGAWVATGAALLIIVLCHLRAKGILTRRRVILGLCAFAAVLLAVGVISMASGRDSRRNYRRSDEVRMTVWRTVPRMIHDAPFGWGPRLRDVGMAYTKWYAPNAPTRVWYTLVNDHLTILAAGGWIGSGLYLMLWFGGVFLLIAFAWRGGSPVPAALWTSLGVSAFFNVVLLVPLLQILAFASLAVLAFDRRWLARRCWLVPVGAGALCTVAVLAVLGWMGSGFRSAPSLRADGKAVRVNGDDPRVWVVDDGEVLGSIATTWEMRQFYRVRPTAAAVGYLMKLDDVRTCPSVRRLVLAGKRAEEFVRRFAEGDRTLRVPSEIVFVAPPFAPSAVPVDLMARTRVAFVYGEFHARYFPELAQPRQGVTVVRGAEQYIPAWMRFCVD